MEILHSAIVERENYQTEYELERGKPMPSLNHGIIQLNLGSLLKFKYKSEFTVATEVSLDLLGKPATPDILVFDKRPLDWLHDKIKVTDPPLLTIEILSPKQAFDDLKDKIFDIYFPGGVKSAWIVLPTLKAISIFKTDGTTCLLSSGILKDPVLNIEIDLDDVFE